MKIYLAIPYTGIENQSFIKANRMAAKLMNEGHIVFSPISMSHPIAIQCDLPGDYGFWQKQAECFVEWCDEVHVVMINGFRKSKGVNEEIKIAKKLNKPIRYLKYEYSPNYSQLDLR